MTSTLREATNRDGMEDGVKVGPLRKINFCETFFPNR